MKLLQELQKHKIIISHIIYQKLFQTLMSEASFLRQLNRLCNKGQLIALGKGVYCLPQITPFGNLPVSEKEIIDYLKGSNSSYGFLLGYDLYNANGFTTQISKSKLVYSTKIDKNLCTIGNISVRKLSHLFRKKHIPLLELMYVLENFSNIENLNQTAMSAYLKKASLTYSDALLKEILAYMKYKKRTLAFLKEILDYFGINNNIADHLSATSSYNIPNWRNAA